MGYCTTQQLEDRLSAPVLGQRVPEVGDERTRVLAGYIDRASARIDMRLSVRFQTPVTTSPLLADICLNFCLWQIEADRGAPGDTLPKRVQIPYDESIKLLGDLTSGGMELPGASNSATASAGLVVSSPDSLFAPDDTGMEFY